MSIGNAEGACFGAGPVCIDTHRISHIIGGVRHGEPATILQDNSQIKLTECIQVMYLKFNADLKNDLTDSWTCHS